MRCEVAWFPAFVRASATRYDNTWRWGNRYVHRVNVDSRERDRAYVKARKCIFERCLHFFQFVFCALFGIILVHRGPVGWRNERCVLGGMACFVSRDRLDLPILNSLARAIFFFFFFSFSGEIDFAIWEEGASVGIRYLPPVPTYQKRLRSLSWKQPPITTSFLGVLHNRKKREREREREKFRQKSCGDGETTVVASSRYYLLCQLQV